jgi:hypothetical protein
MDEPEPIDLAWIEATDPVIREWCLLSFFAMDPISAAGLVLKIESTGGRGAGERFLLEASLYRREPDVWRRTSRPWRGFAELLN